MRFLQSPVVKIARLSLPWCGVGWMFALLTFNFNRVADSDLGAVAIVITTLVGLHHFLAPFQVMWGRLADRHPILGYRRTPHIVISSLIGSILFLFLPSLAIALGGGSPGAIVLAFGLFLIFGLAMAANGGAMNALVVERTSEHEREVAVAVVRTVMILSIILTAGISKQIMPTYDAASMQVLYNLTPLIVMGSVLLGLLGLERRITPAEHAAMLATPVVEAEGGAGNAFRLAWQLMQSQPQVRLFFFFVLFAIMGIFLQDAILEPFGAETFGMIQEETATFTQVWGGSVLISMIIVAVVTRQYAISKKVLATVGGLGTALGLALIALAGFTLDQALITPALVVMGISTGLFNIGAVTMMMEMTVEGHVGLYMGLWGMAQGLGNGLANVLSGALKTLLIESHLVALGPGYGLIFSFEALTMVLAVIILRSISVQEFHGLTHSELSSAIALETAG